MNSSKNSKNKLYGSVNLIEDDGNETGSDSSCHCPSSIRTELLSSRDDEESPQQGLQQLYHFHHGDDDDDDDDDDENGWVKKMEDKFKESDNHEADIYNNASIWERAMPERLMALSLTLLLETPVLFMISGGSDDLCHLIGRRRYHLLIGFLPLTSAISGNVGLQASTLTPRAISHAHVHSHAFRRWVTMEVGAALYLGFGMGVLLGSIAFIASEYDFAFGVTILVAQILSIVTAGLTGTLAPIMFSFVFQRDSGKWGGPLETAIQDVVGSFAMIVVSYHILKLLGPGPLDPFDICGPSK